MTKWILFLMLLLEPKSPHRATFDATAAAIAKVAADSPLFAGPLGADRTAALMVSVAWFESRFQPDAVGDGKHSYCAFQINDSNFKALGVTKDDLQRDVLACARAAREMMRRSIQACAQRGGDDILNHYAVGGDGCADSEKGRHRVRKARWLLANHPRPKDEP